MSDVEQIKSIFWSIVVAVESQPWQARDYILERAAENLARYINLQIAERTGSAYKIPSGVK